MSGGPVKDYTATEAATCDVPDISEWWHLLSPSEQVYYFNKAVVLSKPRLALGFGLLLMVMIGIVVFALHDDLEMAGWVILLVTMGVIGGFIMAWNIDKK